MVRYDVMALRLQLSLFLFCELYVVSSHERFEFLKCVCLFFVGRFLLDVSVSERNLTLRKKSNVQKAMQKATLTERASI